MTDDQHARQLTIQIDNYEMTVTALRALANELLFDDGNRKLVGDSSVHCGRSFRTSGSNRIRPNEDVSPDLAVVAKPCCCVIAEAKLGFDREEAAFGRRILETAEQLEKYDDVLSGWPDKFKEVETSSHDLVLIVNFEDAKRVSRALAGMQARGEFSLTRSFAVVSILRYPRAEGEWPALNLESGALSNDAKTRKLEDRVFIRPELLALNPHCGLVELCDQPPPLPLMMNLIHKAVVGNLEPEEQEQYNIEGKVSKTVSLSDVAEWLTPFTFARKDKRDPKLPHKRWIEDAMQMLVKIGWAEATADKTVFTYLHKKVRKGNDNPLGRFVEILAKLNAEVDAKLAKIQERQARKTQAFREKLKKQAPLFADQIERDLS